MHLAVPEGNESTSVTIMVWRHGSKQVAHVVAGNREKKLRTVCGC